MAMAKTTLLIAGFATIFILLNCSECLPVDEPRCSKFDFEEKMLEKMVRMEHSGGVMMKEFREIAADVKDSLESMRQEFDDIKREAQEERNSNRQMVRGMLQQNIYTCSCLPFNERLTSNYLHLPMKRFACTKCVFERRRE